MTEVSIEYCTSCDHRNLALRTADRILGEFGHELHGVELRPGRGGVFEVAVDGDVVYDMQDRGYDVDAIVETVGSAY